MPNHAIAAPEPAVWPGTLASSLKSSIYPHATSSTLTMVRQKEPLESVKRCLASGTKGKGRPLLQAGLSDHAVLSHRVKLETEARTQLSDARRDSRGSNPP